MADQRFMVLMKYWLFTSFFGSFCCLFASDADGVLIIILMTLFAMLGEFVIYYFNFPCMYCKINLFEVKNQEVDNKFYENLQDSGK